MTDTETPSGFTLPAVLLSQGFRLRAESDGDLPFLKRLYNSTREDELNLVDWSREQKQAFLAGQFEAQRRHYRHYFPQCNFDLLEQNGLPAGRLYLDVRPARLHIIDISLLPNWRGKGIGTAVLEELQAAGRRCGRAVGIMVEKFNPALRLYRRLGFVEVADRGVYLEMEWRLGGVQLNVA